jgi:hypothetical protein
MKKKLSLKNECYGEQLGLPVTIEDDLQQETATLERERNKFGNMLMTKMTKHQTNQ